MSTILESIFSASFLFSVIRITTPLMFGAMAPLICKQGGVLHIAFEASMLFAAFFGVAASALTQSLFVGLLARSAGRHHHHAAVRLFHHQAQRGGGADGYCPQYAGIGRHCIFNVYSLRRKGRVQLAAQPGVPQCGDPAAQGHPHPWRSAVRPQHSDLCRLYSADLRLHSDFPYAAGSAYPHGGRE